VLGARADGEQRGGPVLRLDAEDRTDGRDGVGVARAGEALRAQPAAADLGRVQAARSALSGESTCAPSRGSSGRGGSRRETTFETPFPAIETP
jgi:hypothetical protein